ncbi:MAG: Flagellar biosynthesis protein FliR, partial [uncultured Blastococcus sp.]
GPLGPGGHAGGTAPRDGAGHRLRAAGPALQLPHHPESGQGRVRPGAVPAALDADRAHAARADHRLPARRGGDRGRDRGGAGLRRADPVPGRADGRRPDRPHRRLLAPAGLRPAVDDAELLGRPPALPAGHHAAVHQRRAPADRQGLRDVLRRAARRRGRAHRPDRRGRGDRLLDDVPGRAADRRAHGRGAAARRRGPGAAQPRRAGAEHLLLRLPPQDPADPDDAGSDLPVAAPRARRAARARRPRHDLAEERL